LLWSEELRNGGGEKEFGFFIMWRRKHAPLICGYVRERKKRERGGAGISGINALGGRKKKAIKKICPFWRFIELGRGRKERPTNIKGEVTCPLNGKKHELTRGKRKGNQSCSKRRREEKNKKPKKKKVKRTGPDDDTPAFENQKTSSREGVRKKRKGKGEKTKLKKWVQNNPQRTRVEPNSFTATKDDVLASKSHPSKTALAAECQGKRGGQSFPLFRKGEECLFPFLKEQKSYKKKSNRVP